jgi:hypothetical protein
MKYTRYDYRRKKEDKTTVIVMFVSIVLAAVLLGTALSSLFMKDSGSSIPEEDSTSVTNSTPEPNTAEKNTTVNFIVIQGGYYGVKENADIQKEKLKMVVNPFIVEDTGKYRVLAGIYNEDEYEKIVKKIKEGGLDNAKTTYSIQAVDQSIYQITEIIKGHLKILTTLVDSTVTAVKTEDFKVWIGTLSETDESNEQYQLLEEYKKYVNSLPEEISKEKVEENYIYIYEIIKKIQAKK